MDRSIDRRTPTIAGLFLDLGISIGGKVVFVPRKKLSITTIRILQIRTD